MEESRGYSHAAKCEVKTKLQIEQWERKVAENCKEGLKTKQIQLGIQLDMMGMGEEGGKMTHVWSLREQVYLNKQGSQQKLALGEV